jgi:AcrR family transcriptional regulator
MPRPAAFTTDEILDAALACVARDRHAATVADVARALGGPVGSIYHRFPSRDVVLARLWLRSVARFQAGLFDIAAHGDASGEQPIDMLVRMAVHVPRYCRHHPDEAVALTLYRQDRLLRDCHDSVRPDVAGLNAGIDELSRTLTRRCYGTTTKRRSMLVAWATRLGPYGLVRPYLGGDVPAQLDDVVAASAQAILALGITVPRPNEVNVHTAIG